MEALDNTRAESILSAKKQLQTFRDKQPSQSMHKKRRTHSRGVSIANLDDLEQPSASISIPSPPRSRPSSHHRRQSSISTRRQSAEIMGTALPDDDHDSSAFPDEMRLRALLALEGKSPSPHANSFTFSKVELPDLNETPSEPGVLPPPKGFGFNNSLAGKRDSFGKLITPSSSSKKELHTLLEEDEGEDEPLRIPAPSLPLDDSHATHHDVVPRHRPQTLKLRPLSLKGSGTLPTPSPTPPARSNAKLRSLTLAPSAVIEPPKRSSLLVPTTVPLLTANEVDSIHRSNSLTSKGRTRLTAKTSLLTPNQTPSPLTPSSSPMNDIRNRSPSPEVTQTYLTQTNASLLARIADLEAALQAHQKLISSSSDPSDELLEMLADLKAERDDLMRQLENARAHSAEQDKQIALLGRRIDNERREAWVTKEKLLLAEEEGKKVNKELEELKALVAQLQATLQSTKQELQMEKAHRKRLEDDMETMKRTSISRSSESSRKAKESVDSQATRVGERWSQGPSNTKVTQPDMSIVPEEEEEEQASPRSLNSSASSFQFAVRAPTSTCATEGFQSGWSFAVASRTRTTRSEPEEDDFFACFDTEGQQHHPIIVAPSKTRELPSFGVPLLESDDEDDGFNFGQSRKPSATLLTPSDSEDEHAVYSKNDDELPPLPEPFVDDEDNSFSFTLPSDAVPFTPPSPTDSEAPLPTPRLTPPQRTPATDIYSETPKSANNFGQRHRSRASRISIDLRTGDVTAKSAPPTQFKFPPAPPPPPVPVSPPPKARFRIGGKGQVTPVPIDIETKSSSNVTPKKPFGFGRSSARDQQNDKTPKANEKSLKFTTSVISTKRGAPGLTIDSRAVPNSPTMNKPLPAVNTYSPELSPPPSRSPLSALSDKFAAFTTLLQPATWSPRSSPSPMPSPATSTPNVRQAFFIRGDNRENQYSDYSR